MDNEWRTDVHEGYRTKVIKIGNCTCEINRPILDDTERRKREEAVIQALAHFGKVEEALATPTSNRSIETLRKGNAT